MLPKQLRERHGLREGVKLDVSEDGASIRLTPQPAPIEIVEEDGRLVAVGGAPVTDEDVRAILDDIRR
jgi:bifunctional DNA-binding transcriptional regulator/antitoxin component of YhaV-PrlF toxin-antitoxin module